MVSIKFLEQGDVGRVLALYNFLHGVVFLTPAQLAMLLEGIDWRQPKRLLTSRTML